MFGFIYSLFAYVAFLAVFTYFVLFTDGILVPGHVDAGDASPTGVALAINLALLLSWGLQHSVMARESYKKRLVRVVPKHLERSTFVLASSLMLGALMAGWQTMGGVVWQVESTPVASFLWAVNALGWVGVPLVTFLIDHFDLFGLKQSYNTWRRKSLKSAGFVTPWLYRYMRHPMMTALLIALWATPRMTVSHMVLSLGMSLYIFVGVHFEERSLVRELGSAYLDYQATTPKFIPKLTSTRPSQHVEA